MNSKMGDTTEERLQREKEFHNQTFSDNTRNAAKKYYTSADRGKSYYKKLILKDIEGKKALEYGCGPGSAAFDLAKNGAQVTAIDISDVAIQQTLEKADSEGLAISASVMDAENLDFNDQSFDLICGSGILHHLDLKRSYEEIQRVLTTDGRAVFFEPLGHNPIINLYRNLTPSMRTDDEHPLLVKDLEFAKNYFNNVDATYFNLTATLASFVKPLNNPLHGIDRFLFKNLPFLRKHAWIVVLEFSAPK